MPNPESHLTLIVPRSTEPQMWLDLCDGVESLVDLWDRIKFLSFRPDFVSMTGATPQISSDCFRIEVSHALSPVPVLVTLTQLLPSTSFLLHVTTSNSARLGDSLVVSMPRGNDVVSSRLEGLARLDDDMDRLSRLLGFMLPSTFD